MQPFCYYEETEIRKHYLPESWKDESVQENLKDFLQERGIIDTDLNVIDE